MKRLGGFMRGGRKSNPGSPPKRSGILPTFGQSLTGSRRRKKNVKEPEFDMGATLTEAFLIRELEAEGHIVQMGAGVWVAEHRGQYYQVSLRALPITKRRLMEDE